MFDKPQSSSLHHREHWSKTLLPLTHSKHNSYYRIMSTFCLCLYVLLYYCRNWISPTSPPFDFEEELKNFAGARLSDASGRWAAILSGCFLRQHLPAIDCFSFYYVALCFLFFFFAKLNSCCTFWVLHFVVAKFIMNGCVTQSFFGWLVGWLTVFWRLLSSA